MGITITIWRLQFQIGGYMYNLGIIITIGVYDYNWGLQLKFGYRGETRASVRICRAYLPTITITICNYKLGLNI